MRKSVKAVTQQAQAGISKLKLREKGIFLPGALVGVGIWWLVSSIYSYAEVRVANSCLKYEMVEIEGRYFECREMGG